jgi:uncharacterized membrane protein YdjX (TVP38/TMEM64 family)
VKPGRWVVGGLAALVALGVALFLLRDAGLPDLRRTVQSAGLWAPLLFVLLQAVVTVCPVPRTFFTVAAGVLFGSISGLLLTVTGTALAAAGAFWLARLLGGRIVERYARQPLVAWIRARLDRSGLLAMVSLRLIPAMPFSVLNYASGVSGVRFPPFVLGTVLGVLPGTVAVVVLGDAAVGGNPHPAMFAVSLVCGLIGLAGSVLAARRVPAPAGPVPGDREPTD